MGTILIGLGEFAVTGSRGDTIRTLGLGSCVAVMAFHAGTGAIGMAHIVLPEAKTNPQKARELPAYFADTGIPSLFEALGRLTGGQGRYLVKLAGGAAILKAQVDLPDALNIGKRNVLATRKALWQRGLGAVAEDVLGEGSRSVSISQGSPDVEIRLGTQLLRTI